MSAENEKKPPLEAVALEYTPDKNAPRVVASGKALMAERIIQKANAHQIPVHRDGQLAHALNLLKIGDEIPPELYSVVAQILVHVGNMDKLAGEEREIGNA